MKDVLRSVGIDVGTTTTQLVFSDITVEDLSNGFTVPRVEIVDKQIIHRGEIHFTPLTSATEIDAAQLRRLIEVDYQVAGLRPDQIRTGAVVITGETARKQNADDVLQAIADLAGEFVVATAGPSLESVLAGRGAGADRYSKQHGAVVANFDIGGGTSNYVLFDQGQPITTSCLDIGGRLIRVDQATMQVTYVAPKIAELCATLDLTVTVGQRAGRAELERVAQAMCQLLEMSLGLRPKSGFYPRILTEPGVDVSQPRPIEVLMFSGGVADCIADTGGEPYAFGDIGVLLGRAIAQSDRLRQIVQVPAAETIRATVVGAGTHTTELSGSTIEYDATILPLKNIPALTLTRTEEDDPATMTQAIRERAGWFTADGGVHPIAIAFTGPVSPSFQQVQRLAQAIVAGVEPAIRAGVPTIVVTEADLAKVLGQSIRALAPTGHRFVCIDGVRVKGGDYIDIGTPIANGTVLPVVVKTLVFH